jgi:transcriptional regulator with XRE-family HTH domain
MNERLKEIRRSLGLRQIEFAEKIGLTQAYLSMLESGKSSLSEQNIKLVCLCFDVSETWLRTGLGPMFTNSPKTPDDEEFIMAYMSLLPENKDFLRTTVKSLLDTQIRLLSRQQAVV